MSAFVAFVKVPGRLAEANDMAWSWRWVGAEAGTSFPGTVEQVGEVWVVTGDGFLPRGDLIFEVTYSGADGTTCQPAPAILRLNPYPTERVAAWVNVTGSGGPVLNPGVQWIRSNDNDLTVYATPDSFQFCYFSLRSTRYPADNYSGGVAPDYWIVRSLITGQAVSSSGGPYYVGDNATLDETFTGVAFLVDDNVFIHRGINPNGDVLEIQAYYRGEVFSARCGTSYPTPPRDWYFEAHEP